eukprot:c23774_g4_i2 orf=563-862(-)
MVETAWDVSPEWRVIEEDCIDSDILNIFTYEGFDMPESYKLAFEWVDLNICPSCPQSCLGQDLMCRTTVTKTSILIMIQIVGCFRAERATLPRLFRYRS